MADREGPVAPNQNLIQDPEETSKSEPTESPTCSKSLYTKCSSSMGSATWVTINRSHFKPEYAGKPDEDVEAHLLRTNDWMDTPKFLDQVKVQRFCLTLVGEARLWYESLRLINVDWVGLQNILGSNILR